MVYDVVIVGGGVIGCSVAHELAKYRLNVVLLEKNNDLCGETSSANSAIVHSGYDPEPDSEKARFNVLGNSLFPELCKDLDVPFVRDGSLTVAANEQEMSILRDLAARARKNKVPVELISQEKLQEMEPNLSKSLIGALYAPTCGYVNPFELTVALMENAMDNGVELKLNCKVENIKPVNGGKGFVITTESGEEIITKYVVNAAGVHADEVFGYLEKDAFSIKPRKGQYFVLDHFAPNFVNHTIFVVPSDKGKGVLISPTTSGNYIIGPSSEFVDSKEDVSTTKDVLDYVKEQAKRIMENVPYQFLIREYSGLRAVSSTGDFIIGPSKKYPFFINLAGIQSPGLASSPAIAKEVVTFISKEIQLFNKTDYKRTRRPVVRFAKLSSEEKQKAIKNNPLYGHVVCRCEKVTEGEIIDCIHRNAGATTVKGVKKRCRPGFGKCQGTFCELSVIKILTRELHKSENEICYDGKTTNILKYETKVGDSND